LAFLGWFISLCGFVYFGEKLQPSPKFRGKSYLTDEQKWINYIESFYENRDWETPHREADKALCLFLLSLGYPKIVEAWEKAHKSYS